MTVIDVEKDKRPRLFVGSDRALTNILVDLSAAAQIGLFKTSGIEAGRAGVRKITRSPRALRITDRLIPFLSIPFRADYELRPHEVVVTAKRVVVSIPSGVDYQLRR